MIDVFILLAKIVFYGLIHNWPVVLVAIGAVASIAAMIHFAI